MVLGFTKKLITSGAVQVVSNEGIIDLASNTYVNVNDLHLDAPLALTYGGLGASYADAAAVRAGLGLAVGTDVQAQNAFLQDLAGAEPSNNQYVKYDGANLVFAALPSGTDYNADESTLTEADNVFSVKDGGIGSIKLADGAVIGSKIGDAEISAAKLQSNSVTNAKLADDAVDTAELVNSAVTADKLAANAVTSSKLDSSVASTGLSFNSGALQVDSTAVCMLTGTQVIGGDKSFSSAVTFKAGVSHQVVSQSGFKSELQFEAQTVDATLTTVGFFGIDSDSAAFVVADVLCCSDDMADFAAFRLFGLAKNTAGTSALGHLSDENVHRSDAQFTCVLDVDDTSDQVRVRCKGDTGKNLRWHVSCSVVTAPKYVA